MNENKWWIKLQPLRIPPGWNFMFNKFQDLEPETVLEQDDIWSFYFVQDIMYLYSERKRKVNKQFEEQTIGIDLGWYPDSDPNGNFFLLAVLNGNWETPLLEFSSRNKCEIVEKLEHWLFNELYPASFLDEASFRKNHPKRT